MNGRVPGWQPVLDAIEKCDDLRTRHCLQLVADQQAAVTEGDFHHMVCRALVGCVVGDGDGISGEDIYAGEVPGVIREISPDELAHLGPADRNGEH